MAKDFYSQVQRVAATFSPTVDAQAGRATAGRYHQADRHRGAERRHRLCDLSRAKALGIALSTSSAPATSPTSAPANFFEFMVQDASTDVILLFIEVSAMSTKFLAAARRAAEIGKPVIVTKVGRSDAGERARRRIPPAWPAGPRPMTRCSPKYGFIVSNDLDEAVTIAAVLTTNPMRRAIASPFSRCPGGARHLGRGYGCDAGAAGAGGFPSRSRRKSASCCRPMARQATRSMSPRRACTLAVCRGASICSNIGDIGTEVDASVLGWMACSACRMGGTTRKCPFPMRAEQSGLSAQNQPAIVI